MFTASQVFSDSSFWNKKCEIKLSITTTLHKNWKLEKFNACLFFCQLQTGHALKYTHDEDNKSKMFRKPWVEKDTFLTSLQAFWLLVYHNHNLMACSISGSNKHLDEYNVKKHSDANANFTPLLIRKGKRLDRVDRSPRVLNCC